MRFGIIDMQDFLNEAGAMRMFDVIQTSLAESVLEDYFSVCTGKATVFCLTEDELINRLTEIAHAKAWPKIRYMASEETDKEKAESDFKAVVRNSAVEVINTAKFRTEQPKAE